MRPVTISIEATDACALRSELSIRATASSDQQDDTPGSKKANDVNGQDGFAAPVDISSAFTPIDGRLVGTIRLRAERTSGTCRRYTIEGFVSDKSGNQTPFVVYVFVPLSQGAAHPCVDHECDLHHCAPGCPGYVPGE
jgi:hypothetical protein